MGGGGVKMQISCFCGFLALEVLCQEKAIHKGLKCGLAAVIPHQTICQGALQKYFENISWAKYFCQICNPRKREGEQTIRKDYYNGTPPPKKKKKKKT